jgi:hypothetical protein
MCDHYTMRDADTTSDTTKRAMRSNVGGNLQQGIWLRQGDSATSGNMWKQESAACGSAGRECVPLDLPPDCSCRSS